MAIRNTQYKAIRNDTTYCATKQSRVGLTHPGSPTLGRCMCGRTVGPFKRPPTLPLHTLPSHHTPPPPLYSSDTTLSASYQICSDCSTSFSIHWRKIKIQIQWVRSHGLNMKKVRSFDDGLLLFRKLETNNNKLDFECELYQKWWMRNLIRRKAEKISLGIPTTICWVEMTPFAFCGNRQKKTFLRIFYI